MAGQAKFSAGATLCTLLLALASCSLAPDYHAPETPRPAQFKEIQTIDGWKPADPELAAAPRGEWWIVFNDPVLNRLEDQATAANQQLKAGLAAYEQAADLVQAADAALFPIVTASASSLREHLSKNRPTSTAVTRTTYSDHTVSLGATYDIDVFGRLRNELAAGEATADAGRADLESLTLAIHGELATSYFQLRQQDALVKLYADTIIAYRKALDLTRQRFQQGISSGVDVAEAESQLQLAIGDADAVGIARDQLEHAVALLVGAPASDFALPPATLTTDAPTIPAGMPSDLLERRPDIAAAERRVAAANAEIGVARAAFYPDFTIDVLGGYESGHIANWIGAPSRFWSIGPSGTLALFDAGERDAILAEADAAYDETVANYRQAVLAAYREVEDALVSIRLTEDQFQAEQNASKAAAQSLNYSSLRYNNGLATYLEVTTAQAVALQAQRTAVVADATRMTSRVALIRALGGGWGPLPAKASPNPDPASLAHAAEPGGIFEKWFGK